MDTAEELARLAASPADRRVARKLIRFGLQQQRAVLQKLSDQDEQAFAAALRGMPIAVDADAANRQHYEVPADFFQVVLGPHLKYSCCFWDATTVDLGRAEKLMLDLVIERAGLADGQRILDLGCGWGALSLAIAERFPAASVVALCNSEEQRRFIGARAQARGIANFELVRADIAEWPGAGRFDRIVSIEMLEHLRNYELLFGRVARWLTEGGRFFVQIFCHRDRSSFSQGDVTGEHFFTGGMIPARSLLPRFDKDLVPLGEWAIDGTHYQRTAEAWLEALDAKSENAAAALASTRSPRSVETQLAFWRLFFLITAESFGFDEGREWLVAHYLFGARHG